MRGSVSVRVLAAVPCCVCCAGVRAPSTWPGAAPKLPHVSTPGSPGAGPAPGQSGARVACSWPRHGALRVHGWESWLTSVVLSCRFSGVRTDEAWPVFTLCVFPCLFLFPPHLHRTLPSNKTNFHLSDQREGWSFSLLIHLQYATSDGTFPVGRGEPSPRGEGALQTLAPFQARPKCA